MKQLVFIFFILNIIGVKSQIVDTVYNDDSSVEVFHYNKDHQLDGTYIKYLDDGFWDILIEGEYKNGVKVGKWKEYIYDIEIKNFPKVKEGITRVTTIDQSRIIRNTWTFKKGKKEKEFLSEIGSFPLGKYKVDHFLCFGTYKNDKPYGKWLLLNTIDSPDKFGDYIGWIEFDENGEKTSEWKITEGSANHGLILPFDSLLNNYPITVTYDDGSFGKGYFNDGVKIGKWEYFNKGGELKKEEVYSQGVVTNEKQISLTKVTFNNAVFKHIDFIDYCDETNWLLLADANYEGVFSYWLYDIKDTLLPILIKHATLNTEGIEICSLGFMPNECSKIGVKNCKEFSTNDYQLDLLNDELMILETSIEELGFYYSSGYLNELGIHSDELLKGNWIDFNKVSQFHHLFATDISNDSSIVLNLATGESKKTSNKIELEDLVKTDLDETKYSSIIDSAGFDKNFVGAWNKMYKYNQNKEYFEAFKKDIPELEPINFFYFPGQKISEKKQFHYVYHNLVSFTDKRDGKNLIFFWNAKQSPYKRWVNLNMKPSGAYILYTPDNYYMVSKSLHNQVFFEKDLNTYPLEQFDLKYNRPDIILDRLGYADSSLIAAYHQAYLKRLKKMGFTEEMLEDDFQLPEIKIENLDQIPLENEDGSININLEMHDSKYKLDRINVWVNDVAVYGTEGVSLRDKNIQDFKTSLEVKLAKGNNKVQVSVLNQVGAESYKETFEIECKSGKAQPDLYLITIGESEFIQTDFNLTYASKDAIDIATLLKRSKVYGVVYSKTLTNELVTKENIIALKAFLKQADINDHVMVFFAGHGVLSSDLDYYLATYDMDFNAPEKRGLAYEDLESLLDGIVPLKKTLIIDACHSGEIDKDEMELAVVTNTTQGDVQFRAVGKTVKSKLGSQNTMELTKSLFADFRKGTGATVISSAGGMEFAMESDEWKNGLFTFSLLKGIETGEADLDKNGEIWLSELQQYISTTVLKLSKGKQQPTSRIENQTVDFRVW